MKPPLSGRGCVWGRLDAGQRAGCIDQALFPEKGSLSPSPKCWPSVGARPLQGEGAKIPWQAPAGSLAMGEDFLWQWPQP